MHSRVLREPRAKQKNNRKGTMCLLEHIQSSEHNRSFFMENSLCTHRLEPVVHKSLLKIRFLFISLNIVFWIFPANKYIYFLLLTREQNILASSTTTINWRKSTCGTWWQSKNKTKKYSFTLEVMKITNYEKPEQASFESELECHSKQHNLLNQTKT